MSQNETRYMPRQVDEEKLARGIPARTWKNAPRRGTLEWHLDRHLYNAQKYEQESRPQAWIDAELQLAYETIADIRDRDAY